MCAFVRLKKYGFTLYYAGRMMHVMAEFYGSEMMVPFGPKAITNLCTSFHRDDTKEGDMIETIARFKDIEKTIQTSSIR